MTSQTLRKILVAVGAVAALSVAACGKKAEVVNAVAVDNSITVDTTPTADKPTPSGKLQ